MKTDRLGKIYGEFTNKERAALVFRYISEENELEWQRIESTVPWKSYNCIAFDYRQYLDGFVNMALHWAMEHWKLRTRHVAALGLSSILRQRQKDDQADEVGLEYMRLEAKLLALDKALEVICGEQGLDIATIRKFSGTEPFFPYVEDLLPDLTYQAEVQIDLSRYFPYSC